LIRNSCKEIQAYLKRRGLKGTRSGQTAGEKTRQWAEKWVARLDEGPAPLENPEAPATPAAPAAPAAAAIPVVDLTTDKAQPISIELTTDQALERDWKRRWEEETKRANLKSPYRQPQASDKEPDFKRGSLKRYEGLQKAESSILCQARTGKIGLRSFLFSRKVPDILTPLCRCGRGEETVYHIVVECDQEEARREGLGKRAGENISFWAPKDLFKALHHEGLSRTIARWLLHSGRLQEYRLAVEIETKDREDEWYQGRMGRS